MNFASLSDRRLGKSKKDSRTCQEVAEIISKAQVQGVILNACESASTLSCSDNNSLAEVFLNAGVSFLLGASAVFMESAAEIFMGRLYEGLFLKKEEIEEAVQAARLSLLSNSKRRARFHQIIDLKDFAVPVLYLNSTFKRWTLPIGESMQMDRSRKQKFVRGINTPQPILGRDTDILELELRCSIMHVIFLYGQGGIGKTTLLRYCAWLWGATRWIQDTLYVDFSQLPQQTKRSMVFDAFVNELRVASSPQGGLENTESLLQLLQQRRYLVILDGVEAVEFSSLKDKQNVKSFIDSIVQDQSIVIISGRRKYCEMADMVPAGGHFCLSGISMQGAMRLAESHASWTKSQALASDTNSRASLDFLDRILILLERNPLAIKLVFPSLGIDNQTPEMLFHNLIRGHVDIGSHGTSSAPVHKFVIHLHLLSLDLSLEGRNSPKLSPVLFAPFWNFFPRDLRNYFWFIWAPAFKNKVKEQADKATLGNWTQPEWQDYVFEAMHVFGLDGELQKLLKAMEYGGILDEAEITYVDGSVSQGYHINPVFTLVQRQSFMLSLATAVKGGDDVNVERLQALHALIRTAYVNFQIIDTRSITPRKSSRINKIVWDSEIQHQDHCTNTLVATFAQSLDQDIIAEINRHGMATSDIIVGAATDLFWENRRTVEVLKPLIRYHLVRLATVATFRLERYEVERMLDYAHLLVQAEDYTALDIVEASLRFFEAWKAKGGELDPVTELGWFQVRHAEGKIARHRNLPFSRMLFEKNLAMNPVTHPEHGLYSAIRRVQVLNLQDWLAHIVEETSREGDRRSVMSYGDDFWKTIGVGRFADHLFSWVQETDPMHNLLQDAMNMPFQTFCGLEEILKDNSQSVARFSGLTKSILATPVAKLYMTESTPTTDEKSDLFSLLILKSTLLQEEMLFIEFWLRLTSSSDRAATMAVLNAALDRETNVSRTSWRKLAQIHNLLFTAASKHNDWGQAIRHLDELSKLFRSGDCPYANCDDDDEIFTLLFQYISCYAKFNELEKAAAYFNEASEIMKTMDDSETGLQHLTGFVTVEAPALLDYMGLQAGKVISTNETGMSSSGM